MDRTILEAHLALAQEHVARGEEYIARQRSLIIKLYQDGHRTESAVELLELLKAVQEAHLADLDRLLNELRKHG